MDSLGNRQSPQDRMQGCMTCRWGAGRSCTFMLLTGHKGMSAVGPMRVTVERMNAPMIISRYVLMPAAATQPHSQALYWM